MLKKLEQWFYGGKSKEFFIKQGEEINKYNSKMMESLLLFITILLGINVVISAVASTFAKYFLVYFACFIAFLLMLCIFKRSRHKSVGLTRTFIILFSVILYIFICILGTLIEPNTKATLLIIYILVLPMLFIVPTHFMYGFLVLAVGIFSIIALRVKELFFAQMDISQSVTCLIIGLFICHHILEGRIALYSSNEQLDARNLQLQNEIDKRKLEQEELRLRLEHHQIIMNQTTDILFEWDIRKDTLTFSQNWYKKFGYEAIQSEISQRIPLSANIHPEDIPAFVKIMKNIANGAPYYETEFRIKDIKDNFCWCRIRATAQFDGAGKSIKAVGVILDISQETAEKLNLLKLAARDALTGIYNKAATNSMVMRRMQEFSFAKLQALLIIDIDYFKNVNDTYGHMAGDDLLVAVAHQLRNCIRDNEVVGRIGGDEFLVYLPETESEKDALVLAENLRASLGAIAPKSGEANITCSIGMAVFPHINVEFADLYQYADTALYNRKELGRNGVSIYNEETRAKEFMPKLL